MLEDALLIDAGGLPRRQRHKPHSSDWDEVRSFCRDAYMPYRTEALTAAARPDATMYSFDTGRILATRFAYGTPVHLSDFDPSAGRVLVLTTLRGAIEHSSSGSGSVSTRGGESFVVDCSRTSYWLRASPDHLQLNLTIAHDTLANFARQWFDVAPGDGLWTTKTRFGDRNGSWIALMEYLARFASQWSPDNRASARVEEMVCLELLKNWAANAGIELDRPTHEAAPFYVRRAEEFMRAHVAAMPTMTEVAAASGVSVRTLSGAFRRYRGASPSAFLREQRLLHARRDLLEGGPEETVGAVASRWGYVNFSEFARSFRQRFGELPSAVRRAHN